MARIPNHEIDAKIQNFESFENYNGTIVGERIGNDYNIGHWNTTVLLYDLSAGKIVFLNVPYISQTTSTLLGRIVRSLPRSSVVAFMKEQGVNLNKNDKGRIVRMARL